MHALATGATIAPTSRPDVTPVPASASAAPLVVAAPAKKRWVVPAVVAGVLVAGGLGFMVMNGGSKSAPAAAGSGSAASQTGSPAPAPAPTPTPAPPAQIVQTPPVQPPTQNVGSAGSAIDPLADPHATTKPGAAKHHTTPAVHGTDKTVPHGDKTVPHSVETVKPEGPKPPDPPKTGSAALPF
jgi:hypothetical protein